jgi:SAM-dependent methyltransferase
MKTSLPRRLSFLFRHFPQLIQQPVLDVGCGDGQHLRHFGPGSVGLDGRVGESSADRQYVQWNFEDDVLDVLRAAGLSQFGLIWCNDVLEHHPSPHMLLLSLRRALRDDGLLFLGVPLVNWFGRLPVLRGNGVLNFFRGYQSQDHVNFYRFSTLLPTAGFAGLEPVAWYSPFFPWRRPPMFGIEPVTVLVLSKMPQFNYGPKAYKVLDSEGRLRWKSLASYSADQLPK